MADNSVLKADPPVVPKTKGNLVQYRKAIHSKIDDLIDSDLNASKKFVKNSEKLNYKRNKAVQEFFDNIKKG
jgi:hypothetical protein